MKCGKNIEMNRKGESAMNQFAYDETTKDVLEQLQKGAFLTVKANGRVNTMTIGWATFGYVWKKPVLTVYVRQSRYTWELLKDAKDFTVSIPLTGQLKKELGYTGKMSGRDVDKLAETGLTLLPSEVVESPAIAGCNAVYECRILAHHTLEKAHYDDEPVYAAVYPTNDLHTVFYGEIVNYKAL